MNIKNLRLLIIPLFLVSFGYVNGMMTQKQTASANVEPMKNPTSLDDIKYILESSSSDPAYNNILNDITIREKEKFWNSIRDSESAYDMLNKLNPEIDRWKKGSNIKLKACSTNYLLAFDEKNYIFYIYDRKKEKEIQRIKVPGDIVKQIRESSYLWAGIPDASISDDGTYIAYKVVANHLAEHLLYIVNTHNPTQKIIPINLSEYARGLKFDQNNNFFVWYNNGIIKRYRLTTNQVEQITDIKLDFSLLTIPQEKASSYIPFDPYRCAFFLNHDILLSHDTLYIGGKLPKKKKSWEQFKALSHLDQLEQDYKITKYKEVEDNAYLTPARWENERSAPIQLWVENNNNFDLFEKNIFDLTFSSSIKEIYILSFFCDRDTFQIAFDVKRDWRGDCALYIVDLIPALRTIAPDKVGLYLCALGIINWDKNRINEVNALFQPTGKPQSFSARAATLMNKLRQWLWGKQE